jgi:hypothetical protein
MLADPQTIASTSCPCISKSDSRSIYKAADDSLKLTISHSVSGKRTRHLIRLDQYIVAEDPLSAVNVSQQAAVYMVIDEPEFGFTDEQLKGMVNAVQAYVSADTFAVTYDVLELQH